MKEITVTSRESGQRLDKYLIRYLPAAGKGFLYKMLRKKNIVLNGRRAGGNELLMEGDAIRLFFSEDTLAKFRIVRRGKTGFAALSGAQIVYEDSQVLQSINRWACFHRKRRRGMYPSWNISPATF